VAVKVRDRIEYNLPEEMLGYELLRQLVDTQERMRELEAMGGGRDPSENEELSRLTERLTSSESFLAYLIDVQERYGISAYFL